MGAIHSNNQSSRKALERLMDSLGNGAASLSEHEATLEKLRDMNLVNDVASRRIIEIVSNLRRFARLDESEWKQADLREGLEETLALVEHQTRGRIQIVRSYGDVPPVGCYPGQLNQVFMNLLVNAIQAIEGEGRSKSSALGGARWWCGCATTVGSRGSLAHLTRLPTVWVWNGPASIAYRIASNHGGSLREERGGPGAEFTPRS
jgi:hypothetical protein